MNEKRFRANFDVSIYDSETEEYISVSERGLKEIAKRMNEQQATIEQLKAQLREKEEDEKLYANEILELREINKEWLQCKNLGGDY